MDAITQADYARKRILVNIEPTSYCSANCVMCPRDVISQHGNMSVDTLNTVLQSVSSSFVNELSFAGRGEPMLHPNLPGMLRIARNTGIPVSVVTTGVNLDGHRQETVVSNIDVIRLSVSSYHPVTFKKIHRGLHYDQIWKNIEDLARMAPEKVVVHLTGGSTIYEHLPETVDRLRAWGLDRIRLFPLWNRGGTVETPQDRDRREKLMTDLGLQSSESEYGGGCKSAGFQQDWREGLEINPQYCAVGDSSISVHFDGAIVGCFQDFGRASVLSTASKISLYDFWRARKEVLGKMKVCEGCNVNMASIIQLKKLDM